MTPGPTAVLVRDTGAGKMEHMDDSSTPARDLADSVDTLHDSLVDLGDQMQQDVDDGTPSRGWRITPQPDTADNDVALASEVEGHLDALFDAVVDITDDELRLRVLNDLLDGRVRRALEGERQRLDPWGSWMHSSLLDTAKPGEHETAETRKHVATWEEANVLYSKSSGCQPGSTGCLGPDKDGQDVDLHVLALDIDLPIRVVPSTHPGRGHLWIRKPMPWDDVLKVLAVLVEVGVVAPSYEEHSQRRGYTCLRPAFIDKKPWSWSSDTTDPEPEVSFVDGDE